MVQYIGINADFDHLQKDRRAMKRNRLALFAAFLHCNDEVKVASRRVACSRKF